MILISACSTTNYNTQESYFLIRNEKYDVTELVVTPDRISLQCSYLGNKEARYFFQLGILDEQNTVITVALGFRPDKKGCSNILRKVDRILKSAKSLYIAGRHTLTDKPRKLSQTTRYTFPTLGTFPDNDRFLDWALISNDKGDCYNPHALPKESCLEYPFPIEKYEDELKKKYDN